MSNEALIIVDMQNGFNTNLDTQEVEEKLSNINKNDYDMIIATKFVNKEESMFVKQLNYHEMFDVEDTEFLSIVKELYDIQVPKNGYDGSNKIVSILNNTTIDTVYVIGFDTDGCVLSTALGLFDNGYKAKIIEELCASSGGEDVHQAALAVLERCIGRDNVI